jgi:hypothetical protein
MSVGGVGGGGAPSAGSSANAGGASTGSVSAGEGVATGSCEDASTKDISDAGDKAGTTYNITQIQNNNIFSNISTQDSMELYSCVQQSSESTEMDLQKLIELMIIMKLLESMNESSSSSGGFSTIA